MSSLPSSPSPFSHWEKGSRIEVPLSRERDLGFDVSAQPNGEGRLSGYNVTKTFWWTTLMFKNVLVLQ